MPYYFDIGWGSSDRTQQYEGGYWLRVPLGRRRPDLPWHRIPSTWRWRIHPRSEVEWTNPECLVGVL